MSRFAHTGALIRGRWRLAVAALIAACLLAASAAGPSGALAAAPPKWTGQASNSFTCPVRTKAEGRIKKVYLPGGAYERRLQLTTTTHIGPNDYWFVGCRAGISVDVVDNQGVVLETIEHEAVAGSVFDPFGNDKDYSWVDNPEIADEDLDTIHHLEVRQTAR
jgi:hypothetical protein